MYSAVHHPRSYDACGKFGEHERVLSCSRLRIEQLLPLQTSVCIIWCTLKHESIVNYYMANWSTMKKRIRLIGSLSGQQMKSSRISFGEFKFFFKIWHERKQFVVK